MFNAKELIKAVRAILKHTNATPFRIKLKTYNCFFCPCNAPGFEEPEDLRQHTHSVHDDKVVQIEFAIRPHHMNQMVRFDIANLTCGCEEEVNWTDLLDHLETVHNVTDIKEAWDKLVPYTLTRCPGRENTCTLCNYTACFSKLDTHMNIHFKNYMCGECGKPYITTQRLKSHQFYHELGEYRCDHCDLVFSTPKSRRQHVNIIHEKKLAFKCTVCEERFVSDRQKLHHLRSQHQDQLATSGRTCELCNESFWTKDYWRHMRRKHSQILCSACKKTFENQRMMDNHVCKGEGVTRYQCDLCFKLFFTVRAVVRHKLSTHEK